jgi:hypothetical protein
MFSIVLPERVSRSPRSIGHPSPIHKDHPRGLTVHHATRRLNGLSIARGIARRGFELMNAKSRRGCFNPVQVPGRVAVSLTLPLRVPARRVSALVVVSL